MKNDTDAKIYIDYRNMEKFLTDRSPYIFVDSAEIIPGKSAKGLKNFTHNEWFFACHFPGNPVVPGVFTLESIMQTAALVAYTDKTLNTDFVYAKKFKDVNLISAVYPGEQLKTEVEIVSIKRGIIVAEGKAYVERNNKDVCVCTAKFDMVIPGVLKSLSPVNKE